MPSVAYQDQAVIIGDFSNDILLDLFLLWRSKDGREEKSGHLTLPAFDILHGALVPGM